MRINDVTIDDKDRIVGMDAHFSEQESKALISIVLNMLYQADKMYFNMHTAEWDFSPDVHQILRNYNNNENPPS